MIRETISSIFFALLSTARASRYATYDYDLTTPQFTPDGRLLQVEYATNACVRENSNPILSVAFGDGNDSILVMATVSSDTAGGVSNDSDEDVAYVQKATNQRAQYRIIEVPVSASYNQMGDSTNPVSAISTSTILVGLSGHLSDANSLLQTIYSHLEEEQSVFGWHRLGVAPVGCDSMNTGGSTASTTTETAMRLARAAADQCQKHAFGGGLRPIGASLLLGAVDTQQRRGRIAMCNTDSSGKMASLVSSIDTKESTVPQVMISGGSMKSQTKLQTLIDFRLKELCRAKKLEEVCRTKKVLLAVLLSLVEEWASRKDLRPAASSLSDLFQRIGGSSNQQKPQQPQIEMVLVSSKMGSFRLLQTDISEILEEHLKDDK